MSYIGAGGVRRTPVVIKATSMVDMVSMGGEYTVGPSDVVGTLPTANANHFVHIASERVAVILDPIGHITLPVFEIVRPRHRLSDKSLEIPTALD